MQTKMLIIELGFNIADKCVLLLGKVPCKWRLWWLMFKNIVSVKLMICELSVSFQYRIQGVSEM